VHAVLPTRSELLERRRRTTLAEQGRDLLSDKRAALTRAFTERSALLLDRLSELEQTAAIARARLADAYAAVGPAELRSTALADRTAIGVEVSASVIAGVAVVDLEHDAVRRRPLERGHGAATTDAVIDDVADAYEEAIDDLLDLAALELTVRRLALEIARTTRQVNALEHVLIPRLRAEARQIALALDEREREEIARLRRARERRTPPTQTDPRERR
jgi:V/A-type H+-transporting ATPase subunit D